MAMENLQLQAAYSVEVPRGGSAWGPSGDAAGPAGAARYSNGAGADAGAVAGGDDPLAAFCLDSGEPGVLYAASRAGAVLCLQQQGKQVRTCVRVRMSRLQLVAAPRRGTAARIAHTLDAWMQSLVTVTHPL
jgi:hypothetical protein